MRHRYNRARRPHRGSARHYRNFILKFHHFSSASFSLLAPPSAKARYRKSWNDRIRLSRARMENGVPVLPYQGWAFSSPAIGAVANSAHLLIYIRRAQETQGEPRMYRNLLFGLVGALLFGAIILHPSHAQSAASPSVCDRACLNGFVNQYLDAVVAHDPSRLAVTRVVKFTENGQQLELGDGFWRSATGKGTYRFYVDVPQTGQVGFEGTMMEAGQPVIMALRLRIEGQKISEIETIVGRGQMAQGGAQNLEK